MSKKMIPIVTAVMLSAQLVTIPTVQAQDTNIETTLNVGEQSDESTSVEDDSAEENVFEKNDQDSILNNEDKLAEVLENDEDVTALISDEIALPKAEKQVGKSVKANNDSKKEVRATTANVSTVAQFVNAWNDITIDCIELQNDLSIPDNQANLAQSASTRTKSVEINGNKHTLNLGNNALYMKKSTDGSLKENGKSGGSTLYVHDFTGISSTVTDGVTPGNPSNGSTAGIFVDLNTNNAYGNWLNNGTWRAKFENITVDSPSSHLTMMSRCEVTFAGTNNIKTTNEPLVVGSVIFAAGSHTNIVSANPTPLLWMNNEKDDSVLTTADSREVTLESNAKVSLRNMPGTADATATVVPKNVPNNFASQKAYGPIAWAFGNITVNQDAVLDMGTAAGGLAWYNRPDSSPVIAPADIKASTVSGGFGNVYVNGGILNLHSSLNIPATNPIIRNVNGDKSAGATIAINQGGSFFVTGNMPADKPVINLATSNTALIMNQPKAFDIKNIGGTGTSSDTNYSAINIGDSTNTANNNQTKTRTFAINNSDISLWNNTTALTTNDDGIITAPQDGDFVDVENFLLERKANNANGTSTSRITASDDMLQGAVDERLNTQNSAFDRIMGLNSAPTVTIQPWQAHDDVTLDSLLAQHNGDVYKTDFITDADKALRARIQMGQLPNQANPNYETGDLVMAPVWANHNTIVDLDTNDSATIDIDAPGSSLSVDEIGDNGFMTIKDNDVADFQKNVLNGGDDIQATVSRGTNPARSTETTTNVIDVTPPTPVPLEDISAADTSSTTISGSASADTASVRLKLSTDEGATWSDFSDSVAVTNGTWTLPLPSDLKAGDQVQIFASDGTSVSKARALTGDKENENPATEMTYHDATFPAATIYTIVAANTDNGDNTGNGGNTDNGDNTGNGDNTDNGNTTNPGDTTTPDNTNTAGTDTVVDTKPTQPGTTDSDKTKPITHLPGSGGDKPNKKKTSKQAPKKAAKKTKQANGQNSKAAAKNALPKAGNKFDRLQMIIATLGGITLLGAIVWLKKIRGKNTEV
ncbi:hypothetical protein EQG49_10540 [Periweissella cryptocerci]|uniref:Uncharacterized protein n=1 Tax=Periweissella cryptocerci TaxID=2506420 RepID=A0A4P6YVM2_9LACO|nr:pectate lyase-like adhesive domain-containing protein [Periweissella cryptocerci]QBO36848.1 hypothetical protein EQG49_10540 [Periweissella cryptocerci]